MADFKTQVTGITSMEISATSSPSQDEFTQFLVDGQRDVALRLAKSKPTDLHLISKVDTAITAGKFDDTVDSGLVVEVLVNDGDDLQPAARVDPGHISRAENTDSLLYRSKYNPGWYFVADSNSRKVGIIPAAQTAGSMKYVVFDNAVTHASTSITDWSDKYEHTVVLYAAMKSIESKLGDYAINEEDPELVQGLAPLLVSLTRQYDGYFEMPKPERPTA